MNQNLVEIPAVKRESFGKGACRKMRAQGQVPANLLGPGRLSQALSLEPKWLSKAWKSGKTFMLVLDGQKTQVKIQELQIHSVTRLPLHVDLMHA